MIFLTKNIIARTTIVTNSASRPSKKKKFLFGEIEAEKIYRCYRDHVLFIK